MSEVTQETWLQVASGALQGAEYELAAAEHAVRNVKMSLTTLAAALKHLQEQQPTQEKTPDATRTT